MKLTKTEQKLLDQFKDKHGRRTYTRVSVFGKREVSAAKKLHEKGLAIFQNESALVRNCLRRRNGDYYSVFVYQGLLKRLDNE